MMWQVQKASEDFEITHIPLDEYHRFSIKRTFLCIQWFKVSTADYYFRKILYLYHSKVIRPPNTKFKIFSRFFLLRLFATDGSSSHFLVLHILVDTCDRQDYVFSLRTWLATILATKRTFLIYSMYSQIFFT